MRVSNFAFLQAEFPDQYNAAVKAEAAVHSDPRTACFYARRALELAMNWLFKHDPALKLPIKTIFRRWSTNRPSSRPQAKQYSTRRG